ncbi:MAG: prepilin-type N-terminal cleavage/methylation domain-containing protein [Gemmatimonadaceae bacterium]
MRAHRPGLTLIEVLAALSILAIAAASWAGLLAQAMQSVRSVRAAETQLLAASGQLARLSTWTAADFASPRRRAVRGFQVEVRPLTPSLFEVTISDTARGIPILRTSFYTRDTSALAAR